jgi:hypothetical protein
MTAESRKAHWRLDHDSQKVYMLISLPTADGIRCGIGSLSRDTGSANIDHELINAFDPTLI